MSSATDHAAAVSARSRRFTDTFKVWNRKFHYYLGLYFLFFLWLFAFTGLLLNHGSWSFAEFWPNRKISSFERQIQRPAEGDDLARARNLMRQLGIEGELQWGANSNSADRLEFQANRPGHNVAIKADLKRGTARVESTEINGWGIMHVLHTFTGVRVGDTRNQRDWLPTTLWALSMDAVALGLIVMVASGLYMWWGLKPKRKLGVAALGLGIVSCAWLLFGVRLLHS
jgi:hypothetical protein